MDDCIFCKIIKGDIPCMKIWEDDNFLAFLDIKPLTEGMTLVIPKEHRDSSVFNNSEKDICDITCASKKVAKILENKLPIERVVLLFEGIEINHLHAKLVPIKGGENLKTLLTENTYKPSIVALEELHKYLN